MGSRSIISLALLAGCFETPELQIHVTRHDPSLRLRLTVEDPDTSNPSQPTDLDTLGDVFAEMDPAQTRLVTVFVKKSAPVVVVVDPLTTAVCFQLDLTVDHTLQRSVDEYPDDGLPEHGVHGIVWTGGDPSEAVPCPKP